MMRFVFVWVLSLFMLHTIAQEKPENILHAVGGRIQVSLTIIDPDTFSVTINDLVALKANRKYQPVLLINSYRDIFKCHSRIIFFFWCHTHDEGHWLAGSRIKELVGRKDRLAWLLYFLFMCIMGVVYA